MSTNISSLKLTCMEAICRQQRAEPITNIPNIATRLPSELFSELLNYQRRNHTAVTLTIQRFGKLLKILPSINLHEISTVGNLKVLLAKDDDRPYYYQTLCNGERVLGDKEKLVACKVSEGPIQAIHVPGMNIQ